MMMNRGKSRGQAMVMLTLALFAMCGLMGLAVDLGWSYYVQKNAQKAADAGALAAAQATLNALGRSGSYDCNSVTCLATPTGCGSISDPYLSQACQVAATNGFAVTNARQNVTLASGPGTPPTAPGVGSYFWVTVRATEQIPQLFSAIFGNGLATVSARATAVVIDSVTQGSLRLINRNGDNMPPFGTGQPKTGVNLLAYGGNTIEALGGFLMASSCNLDCTNQSLSAAETTNNTTVRAPFTYFRGNGWYTNNPTWIEPPVNGFGDGPEFMDPTGGANGISQPPLPAGIDMSDATRVPGGTLVGDCGNPPTVSGKQLYAWDVSSSRPTFEPVTLTGCINFSDGAVFWGGVVLQGAQLTFDEGVYVFAGAKPAGPQRAGDAFSIQGSSDVIIRDTRSLGAPSNGELFIFTDQYYKNQAGNSRLAPITPADLSGDLQFVNMRQGRGGFQTGSPARIRIDLFGVDGASSTLPSYLNDYKSFLMWMDRRNSYTDYNLDTGNIACGNESLSCPNPNLADDGVYEDSTQFFFQATPDTHLTGAIYQPRGSWTTMQGGGGYIGPLQIITGALDLGGSGTITLLPFNNPIRQRTVALVE